MKSKNTIIAILTIVSFTFLGILILKISHRDKKQENKYKIVFLHHSTGTVIYNGGNKKIRFIEKFIKQRPLVERWFVDYNQQHRTNYLIEEQNFPNRDLYGWNNYPYDYYNIWIKNGGEKPYLNEPTLEILTKKYNLIILKHCYPIGDILDDINNADINSSEKRVENYKLQYLALKQKFLEFPNTKFLVWTGAAHVESNTTEIQAQRAKTFFDWVKSEWDTPNDNIYIFDFFELETEGTLFLKPEFAISPNNSHPNKAFARRVAPLFCQRILEVIEQNK